MNSDSEKPIDKRLEKKTQFDRDSSEVGKLRRQLADTEKQYYDLKARFDARTEEFNRECTQRDHTAEALRMAEVIVDQSPVILFRRMAGDEPKLVYVSENIRQWGYTAEAFLNADILFKDIVHPDDSERISEEIRSYADTDSEEYTQIYRIKTASGSYRWVEDQTSVVRDADGVKTHNQGILVDITERKISEEKLRKSEEKFRRIVETAAEGFLLMDENLVITDVNDAYCHLTGYAREELIGITPLDLASDEFRNYMTRNRNTILSKEYRELEGTIMAKDGHQVPILIHGNTLRNDQDKVIGNMAFITDMTENKKALALAGEVQKSLLPQSKPRVPGLDIAGRNVSCDEIGGDYFDFLWRQDSKKGPFGVVVGDISGHGVDSALLMTTARAFLRMRASQPGSISEIITAMNRHLAQDVLDTGRFMTLFYLNIDPLKKRLDWVRAGHDPALLYDPDRDVFEELKGNGVALGIADGSVYEENHHEDLKNSQIIAVGTDGIWEALNGNNEMFGKERLRRIISTHAKAGAADILNAVYNELNEFTLGQKSEDDITLVIIKIDGLDS
jgi:sigma-B regulation protein RsbU (phosphoserine phosphatase)